MTFAGMSVDDLRSLPKAELHAHLIGCVPIETVADVINEMAIELPDGLSIADSVIAEPRSNLDHYLHPWRVRKLLPRTEWIVRRLAAAAAARLSADGIIYAELRASPTKIASLAGVSPETALLWLLGAFEEAGNAAALDLRLVVTITRGRHSEADGDRLFAAMSRVSSPSLVGVDLSGDESIDPPEWLASLLLAIHSELHLGVSIHAGETGSRESVLWALRHVEADRIGHGLALAQDPDLRRLAVVRDVCVETCMHSNYYSGQIRSIDEHPVRFLIESDVPFVLCADNPAIHGKTLSEEYATFLELTRRVDIIESMLDRQLKYAFAKRKAIPAI
jgi:adenosine deaminase